MTKRGWLFMPVSNTEMVSYSLFEYPVQCCRCAVGHVAEMVTYISGIVECGVAQTKDLLSEVLHRDHESSFIAYYRLGK